MMRGHPVCLPHGAGCGDELLDVDEIIFRDWRMFDRCGIEVATPSAKLHCAGLWRGCCVVGIRVGPDLTGQAPQHALDLTGFKI